MDDGIPRVTERFAPEQPPATIVVGGFPEPDGTQPMSPAEIRMVREYLGLTRPWLAGWLGVAERTIARWEDGKSPVPDDVRLKLEALEGVAAEQVGQLVDALAVEDKVVLSIPDTAAGGFTSGWWRMLAARVAVEVPGLYVRYADGTETPSPPA